jgi:aspartate beta-hydroxylase
LTKKSHITPHYGPTNKKLRFHIPLIGIKGSRLRVKDKIHELKENEPYVFDDSFEHEAW